MPDAATSTPAAMIYCPGLNEPAGGAVLEHLAERIARTFDHQDPVVAATYTVKVAPAVPYGDAKVLAEVREIVRSVPGGEASATHRIYFLDYQPELAASQPEGNILTQTLAVLRVWVWMLALFITRAAWVKSVGRRQKTAILIGGGCLLLLTAYMGMLISAAGVTIASLIGTAPAHTPAPVPAVNDAVDAWWKQFSVHWSELALVVGAFGFSFTAFREWLGRTVGVFLQFSRYLDTGRGRVACTGRFNDLLEHVLESSPARVDVVAYSMGSLVALDALFPSAGIPADRASGVRTLTTIGCPFDLVRTFWPDYFEHREVPEGGPRWINLFSPVDLLASNFANVQAADAAPAYGINFAAPARKAVTPGVHGVQLPAANLCYDHLDRRKLSWCDALTLEAYEAHSQYWSKGKPRAESCVNVLVPVIYAPSAAG